jgi:predicted transglutaminase-like cysteine proteinase
MGQAIITDGGPKGLYDVTIKKDPGKSAARLTAIAARLTALTGLIAAADTAVTAANTALTIALTALNTAIARERNPAPAIVAVKETGTHGNGTCTKITPGPTCQEGTYRIEYGAIFSNPPATGWYVYNPSMTDVPNARMGSYSSSEINFTTAEGSIPFVYADGFTIAVTEEQKDISVPSKTVTAALLTAAIALRKARLLASKLRTEQGALAKEQARLNVAMAVERRTGVWCTDLTENLAVGAVVGTMEINGVDDQIILTPGGAVSKAIGLLQHAGVSTGAAVFLNKARLPCWQKWRPTYRVGTIITLDKINDKCSVGVIGQQSEEQGLSINQAGPVYSATAAAVQGWIDFAAANPGFPLVTNTANSFLPSTAQLMTDLKTVQNDVQSRYNYALDTEQYGKLENWALMAPGGKGDCEDFALTKAAKLLALGYPASALHIETGTSPTGQGHAWLVIQTVNGDFALDNNYAGIKANDTLPYTGRKRQTGMNWASPPGVLFADVPIEYMNGKNAQPFVEGDSVIVQFTNKDWTKPKVIGFEHDPRAWGEGIVTMSPPFGIWPHYNYTLKLYSVTRSTATVLKTVTFNKSVVAAAVGVTDYTSSTFEMSAAGWDNAEKAFWLGVYMSPGSYYHYTSVWILIVNEDGTVRSKTNPIPTSDLGFGGQLRRPSHRATYDVSGNYTHHVWQEHGPSYDIGSGVMSWNIQYNNLNSPDLKLGSYFADPFSFLTVNPMSSAAGVHNGLPVSVVGWGSDYYWDSLTSVPRPAFFKRINDVQTVHTYRPITDRSFAPELDPVVYRPCYHTWLVGILDGYLYYTIIEWSGTSYRYSALFGLDYRIELRKAPLDNLETHSVIWNETVEWPYTPPPFGYTPEFDEYRMAWLLGENNAILYSNGDVRNLADDSLLYTIPGFENGAHTGSPNNPERLEIVRIIAC